MKRVEIQRSKYFKQATGISTTRDEKRKKKDGPERGGVGGNNLMRPFTTVKPNVGRKETASSEVRRGKAESSENGKRGAKICKRTRAGKEETRGGSAGKVDTTSHNWVLVAIGTCRCYWREEARSGWRKRKLLIH